MKVELDDEIEEKNNIDNEFNDEVKFNLGDEVKCDLDEDVKYNVDDQTNNLGDETNNDDEVNNLDDESNHISEAFIDEEFKAEVDDDGSPLIKEIVPKNKKISKTRLKKNKVKKVVVKVKQKEEEIKCEQCDDVFATKKELKVHVKTEHEEVGLDLFFFFSVNETLQ